MRPVRILIVEDEFIISEKLARNLRGIGYIILGIVCSGEEAVKAAKDGNPDIIIMDIKLEGELDGIETAREISKTNPVPLIYLTGLTDNNTFARAKKTSPASFLTKPYNQVDINNAIELALFNTAFLGYSDKEKDKSSEDTFFILEDRIFVKDNRNCFNKVEIDDIFYIEGEGSYSTIHTLEEKYLTSFNLKVIEKRIGNPALMRIHRSFIVNLKKIKQIIGKNFVILDYQFSKDMVIEIEEKEKKIPIGPEYRDSIQKNIRFI